MQQQQQTRPAIIAYLPQTPEVNALIEAAGHDGELVAIECYTAMLALQRVGVTGWAAMQFAVTGYLQRADEASAAAAARQGGGMPHYPDRLHPAIEAEKAARRRRLESLAKASLPAPISAALSAVMPRGAA